jgi:hypothetical protein
MVPPGMGKIIAGIIAGKTAYLMGISNLLTNPHEICLFPAPYLPALLACKYRDRIVNRLIDHLLEIAI